MASGSNRGRGSSGFTNPCGGGARSASRISYGLDEGALIVKLYSGKEESRYKKWIHSTNVVECCCGSFAKYIGYEMGL